MSATPHRFHPDAVPLIVDAFRRGIAGCHAFSAATYTLEKLAGNRVDYQRLIIRGLLMNEITDAEIISMVQFAHADANAAEPGGQPLGVFHAGKPNEQA